MTNSSRDVSLQNYILNALRDQQTPVIVYLVNGFRLGGRLKDFDTFIIALEESDTLYIVYKHAISTIIPKRLIDSL